MTDRSQGNTSAMRFPRLCMSCYAIFDKIGCDCGGAYSIWLFGFFRRIDRSGPCWNWTGVTNHGYGAQWTRKKIYLAHRIAYRLMVGRIPEGRELDHLCRNTRCVRPDHLEAVPRVLNVRRGRVTKLTPGVVSEIRKLAAEGALRDTQIARMFGIVKSHVGRLKRRESWAQEIS